MSDNNFKCSICKSLDLEKSEVVTLRCKHIFCWNCIGSYIIDNLNVKPKCPIANCKMTISDSVIRQAIPKSKIEDYEALNLASIIDSNDNCYKCLLPQCGSVVFHDTKELQYECQNCSLFNCIQCKGVHPFMSCKEYQETKLRAMKYNEDKLLLESVEQEEFAKARLVLKDKRYNSWISEIATLESEDIVPNDEPFQCATCLKVVPKGDGVQLRNCYHTFCKACLHGAIINSENVPTGCPEDSCTNIIQDREIQGILNEKEYEIFQQKSLMAAKSKLDNIFHCKKPDCTYFGILEKAHITIVRCPKCDSTNCVPCNVIHKPSETCEDYQSRFGNTVDAKSLAYIEKEILDGKCMKCTKCGSIIKKTSGCNWIRCPQCKLELCWILKMPRWGPKGNGDISGGCKCGVNKIPCDPRCKFGCIPEN